MSFSIKEIWEVKDKMIEHPKEIIIILAIVAIIILVGFYLHGLLSEMGKQTIKNDVQSMPIENKIGGDKINGDKYVVGGDLVDGDKYQVNTSDGESEPLGPNKKTMPPQQTTGIKVEGKRNLTSGNVVIGADTGYDISGEDNVTTDNKYDPSKSE